MVRPAIPLSGSRHARARWLVLAPHPDDETIGAGALIAQTAAEGRLAGVVYLTDGSGSHAIGPALTRGRLIRHRDREARLALRRLAGPRSVPPVRLDWRDGDPPAAGSVGYDRALRRLAAMLRSRRVDALAAPAPDEGHCDHVAAHALARAAAARSRRPVALFGYRVWGGAVARAARPPLVTRALPVGRRRHALMAHRSQTGAALGPGFRLPPCLLRLASRDLLYPDDRP